MANKITPRQEADLLAVSLGMKFLEVRGYVLVPLEKKEEPDEPEIFRSISEVIEVMKIMQRKNRGAQ